MASLNRPRTLVRCQSGNAVIELAFTLPLLLVVVMGILDFGLMFQRYEILTNAAREGARVGVLPGYTTVDAEARAVEYLNSSNLTADSVNAVTSTINVDDLSTPGDDDTLAVTVTVVYTHQYLWIGPILNLFGGNLGSVTLTAVSTMRAEAAG